MKKVLKILMAIGGAFALFLAACVLNHQFQLTNEDIDFYNLALAESVAVDGAKMSVCVRGKGTETIVFLSGSGTCSPRLDFQSLYSLLTDTCKIAVVERFGYGRSDVTNKSRDIDTVLENNRDALTAAGLKPPYILCPHSMSGLEALYWAQTYPDEVSAIIGLDTSVPAAYEEMEISEPLLRLVQFSAAIGLTRLVPGLAESDAVKYGTLYDYQKDLYRVVFYRRTMTSDMVNEALCVKENAAKVAQGEIPDVPYLLFSSNGSGGTGFSEEDWHAIQAGFAEQCRDAQLIYLDCGHYVHDFEYNRIAVEIKDFLNR